VGTKQDLRELCSVHKSTSPKNSQSRLPQNLPLLKDTIREMIISLLEIINIFVLMCHTLLLVINET